MFGFKGIYPTEISFRDVGFGEVFWSHRSKRFFGGIKICPIEAKPESGKPFTASVVIMTDDLDAKAHDAGTLIAFESDRMVLVER